jgi:serine/threonine-protein kinase
MILACNHCGGQLTVPEQEVHTTHTCPRCARPLAGAGPAPSSQQADDTTSHLPPAAGDDTEARVSSLVAQWEQQWRQGQTLSAADLCRDCPELLPRVRQRLGAFLDLAAFLKDSTPTPAGAPEQRAGPGAWPAVEGYEILSELGRGGMGVVYRARHRQLDRVVALKMILAGGHADALDVQRFLVEAAAVAKLHHPHIVPLYDFGRHQGLPYFTLEFMAGGSLHEKLRRGPLPPQAAAATVEAVASGVAHAHQHGLVHRDLKPLNVLLDADGTPRITDFGLVKRVETGTELTASGAVMGTPSYMAPEQARGETKRVGPAADIWALGAILYECLTGRPPFQGPTTMDTLLQVLGSEPVPPRRLQPNVNRDLETICLKCLQKEPPKRYASAAELAEDLRRFRTGETIRARPVSELERAIKWVKRRPTAAALWAALALLAVVVATAAVWYRVDRAGRAAEEGARKSYLNKGVAAALAEADALRRGLHETLAAPLKIHVLLSDIDQWDARVKAARFAWQRAAELAAGNEELLDADVADRLRGLDAALHDDEKDYKVARKLDDIRLGAATSVEGKYEPWRAGGQYKQVFADLGLSVAEGEVARTAEAIRKLPIRYALVAALDHWAFRVHDPNSLDKQPVGPLLAIARAADPDPWRTRSPGTI